MKNYRTPGEVKKSILKGLEEAVIITKEISKDKVSENETLKIPETKQQKNGNPKKSLTV